MFQKVLKQASKGSFSDALLLIENEKPDLDSTLSLKLIFATASACKSDVHNGNISAEDLCKFINKISENIIDLQGQNVEYYLSAVNVILNFFVNKGNSHLCVELIPFINPALTKFVLNGEQKKFLNICNFIHYSIHHNLVNWSETFDEKKYIKLCTFSLEMFSKILNAPELIDYLFMYLKWMEMTNIDFKMQYYVCKKYLDLLHVYKNVDKENLFKLTLSGLKQLLGSVLVRSSFIEQVDLFHFVENIIVDDIYTEEHLLMEAIKTFYNLAIHINKSSGVTYINFRRCLQCFKYTYKTYGTSKKVAHACNLITYIFQNAIQNLNQASSENLWKEFMTPDVCEEMYKIVTLISEVCSQTPSLCSFCDDCNINKNIPCGIDILLIHVDFLNFFGYPENLKKHRYDILSKCCVSIEQLKQGKCKMWETKWTKTGSRIYNTGVNLYKISDIEGSVLFYKLFLKHAYHFEGPKPSMIKNKIVNYVLANICELYIRLREYEKALTYCALYAYNCPDDCNNAFSFWIKAKSIDKQNEVLVQNLTVFDVLNDNQEIKLIYPNMSINKDDYKNLLFSELNAYEKSWPSKIPIANVCEKLYEFYDCRTIAETLVKTYNNEKVSGCELIAHIIYEVIAKFLNKKNNYTTLRDFTTLANLYYICYKLGVIRMISENEKDMNDTIIALDEPQYPFHIENDVNYKCDIVSEYNCVKLNKHLEILLNLDKAVATLETHVITNNNQQAILNIPDALLFDMLVRIAQEYKLQCHTLKALCTWFLAFKLSKLLKDELKMLKCIGFIIELSDTKSQKLDVLIDEAAKIISKIDKDSNDEEIKKLQILTHYYVSVSSLQLSADKVKLAINYFHKAERCFISLNKKKLCKFLKVRMDFLRFTLMMLPCNVNVDEHKKKCLVVIHELFEMVKFLHNSEDHRKSSLVFTLLFYITEKIASWYRWMKLPREVRFYCRDIVLLTQQLVIPLRTAYLLAHLAYADLLNFRHSECQLKINGMSNILCCHNLTNIKHETNYTFKVIEPSVDGVDFLTETLSEMQLSKGKQSTSSLHGSPVFPREPFKAPDFFNHDELCECFKCTSTEYQELILMKIHLETQANLDEQNMKSKQNCSYYNAVMAVKSLKSKENPFENVLKKITKHNILPKERESLNELFAVILLDYGNSLIRSGNQKAASKVNQELITYSRTNINLYLNNEVQLQKINLMMCSLDFSSQYYKSSKKTEQYIDEVKTPENNVGKVKYETNCSPCLESPPKRTWKKIKFNISDHDTDTECTATTNFLKNDFGFLNKPLLKTPVAPLLDINMCSPSTVKSVKKKNIATIQSPTFHTPKVLTKDPKFESGLKSRTKVLTDKLKKNEAKKEEPSTHTCESKTRKTKKKLMNAFLSDQDGRIIGEESKETMKNSIEEIVSLSDVENDVVVLKADKVNEKLKMEQKQNKKVNSLTSIFISEDENNEKVKSRTSRKQVAEKNEIDHVDYQTGTNEKPKTRNTRNKQVDLIPVVTVQNEDGFIISQKMELRKTRKKLVPDSLHDHGDASDASIKKTGAIKKNR